MGCNGVAIVYLGIFLAQKYHIDIDLMISIVLMGCTQLVGSIYIFKKFYDM